jgi:hypothetical protein
MQILRSDYVFTKVHAIYIHALPKFDDWVEYVCFGCK